MWDQRYDTEQYVYGEQPNAFLTEQVHQITGKEVLCLAEGEGRNSVYLAEKGMVVTGVDMSAVGVQKAENLANKKNVTVTYIQADLSEFELGDSQWDAVISIFCHLPPPVRQRLHHQILTALRPGGVLILQAYTPEQLHYKTGGPPQLDMLMSIDQLQAELPGLEFVLLEQCEREIIEGEFHTGLASVVQLVARKPA